MDKNKKQLAVLAAIVVLFLALAVISLLKPRAKKAAAQAKASGQASARLPGAAKGRAASAYQSWGRDPFAIGSSPAEEGSGPVLLSGIFSDPQKSYCIIDGKVAKVGDEVSGYRILEINKDTVTVKTGAEIRILRIGR